MRKRLLQVCLLSTACFALAACTVQGASSSSTANSTSSPSKASSVSSTNSSAGSFSTSSGSILSVVTQTADDIVVNLPEVDDTYTEPVKHEGTLDYVSYTTPEYDDTSKIIEKYAIVYTPYGYDQSLEYDFMYLMHGATLEADAWLGTPEDPSAAKRCLDHLIDEGAVRPMVVVCPSYYDTEDHIDDEAWDAELTKGYASELKNDLMPVVESAYSSFARGTSEADFVASRDHRIIGGFSMGAVTTWYRMADSMSYFHYYFPVSGSLHWGVAEDQAYGDWIGAYLADAVTAQGYGMNDFFVYMATGSADYALEPLTGQIDSMILRTNSFAFGDPANPNVNCSYGLVQNAEHDHEILYKYIYAAMPVLSNRITAASE